MIDDLAVHPTVRPARAGVRVHADDRADRVVLETGGKDVGRAVTQSVGDQRGRAVINLSGIVCLFAARELLAVGKYPPGLETHVQEIQRAVGGDATHQRRIDAVEGFRCHRPGRQHLKNPFGRRDRTSGIAANVNDQSVRRGPSGHRENTVKLP